MFCIYSVFSDKGIVRNIDHTIFIGIFQPYFSKAHNIEGMVLNVHTNFVYFGRQGTLWESPLKAADCRQLEAEGDDG